MRYSDSDLTSAELGGSTEESLRRENEDLRRQLQQLRSASHSSVAVPSKLWRPSALTLWALGLLILVLLVIAFFAGYVPLAHRNRLITDEAEHREQALPRVTVVTVGKSSRNNSLQLPGNIQAITEAPILARADGYIKRRMVDIGDRVQAGQTLAIIEAPELDEQVHQAEATVRQAQAGVDQAKANLQQGRADLELARVTATRWAHLVSDGSVSVQENDQYQAQYKSKIAAVQALEQALKGQEDAVAAAQANVARLENMKGYRVVVAPFDGVITLRNVDSGALVNSGSTLLFRIAQTNSLRIYLNVPQVNASSVHRGDTATLTVSNLPGKVFDGAVVRTANALDPSSRTLLAEVHVPNPSGALLPGMYAQVNLNSPRADPPLLIPSDALIVSDSGTQVAVVEPGHRVHLQPIVAGRDYGDHIEVVSGLNDGDVIIPNPSDVLREGAMVDPIEATSKQ
ncbi:MAG TPA: efflux RND transporter periplasmic adaptor subunit [Bryobacteraceae bacterium]|nr:efflux RND transporter periplasmic adaptor subunit [Bryobacteraceae bacterium]